MFKSYFIKEQQRCNNDGYVYHYYDPHLVFLKENAEDFTLSIYEKLFELTAKSEKIDLSGVITISGVEIELRDVLEKFEGDFNYQIKDLEILDIDKTNVIKLCEGEGIKFFVEQKLYLQETEDDFELKFALVECDSVDKFKEIYDKECEKSAKINESVIFDGLFFEYDDAYDIKFMKKGKRIIHPKYPKIFELS